VIGAPSGIREKKHIGRHIRLMHGSVNQKESRTRFPRMLTCDDEKKLEKIKLNK